MKQKLQENNLKMSYIKSNNQTQDCSNIEDEKESLLKENELLRKYLEYKKLNESNNEPIVTFIQYKEIELNESKESIEFDDQYLKPDERIEAGLQSHVTN